MISVAKDIAEKLQLFLEARFGVRVPIVVTAEYRKGFATPTIWVQRTAIADPDGGTDLTEELSLQEFVRPDNKESLKLQFGYHQVGPSSAIDQWEVRVSGADEADRHVLYDLFDARTWKQATGWGGWDTRLVPAFEYNGVRWQYTGPAVMRPRRPSLPT